MRKEIILSKINEIEESISLIAENMPEDFKNFKELGLIKDGIYSRTQYSIDNIIDIFSIINSDFRLSFPKEEDDVIINLVNAGIISKYTGDKIKELRIFRNQIKYEYGKLDDKLSFELIKENLDDIDKIIENIKTIIDRY
ncbi:MAG: HepT-like ribonuclease domain-containing protein [Methanofastidiosum sp.]